MREIPVELSQCAKLKELDLSNTFIISLPRELHLCSYLFDLKLDGCPLKESLSMHYNKGIDSIQSDMKRKFDKKSEKEELFKKLANTVYPNEPKEEVFKHVELLSTFLKDCNPGVVKPKPKPLPGEERGSFRKTK